MILLLLALLVSASSITLVVVINHDGYGSRPVPRSHEESFAPSSRCW